MLMVSCPFSCDILPFPEKPLGASNTVFASSSSTARTKNVPSHLPSCLAEPVIHPAFNCSHSQRGHSALIFSIILGKHPSHLTFLNHIALLRQSCTFIDSWSWGWPVAGDAKVISPYVSTWGRREVRAKSWLLWRSFSQHVE